ncbi:MAG: hypothetical protein JSU04_17440 [Bdellovibrionales bacterium]|nr:hypothetical protein [Bdellovibrionales bacterium]
MADKSAKLLETEAIDFDEVGDEWLSLNLGGEKYVMDLDTLIDLSFRCTSFLAYLESKQENSLEVLGTHCGCYSTKVNVH